MQSHKDLDVWKRSMELVVNIYRLTRDFPHEEQFGLSSQIRRSAISIPSNIAEGAARNSAKEYKQFLYISLGSVSEIETQILIAEKLGFLKTKNSLLEDVSDIRKMLTGLISYVSKKQFLKKM
ncbi:MAG: four helix bundle protein [Candidatus Aminicenantes bacterium]|nr:four helix bundle protein [Candidatus Aminicenantes bacterium]